MPVKRKSKPRKKQPLKQKQKQSQRQSVVVNVMAGKSRASSSKPKSSPSYQGPLIQSLPLSYTPSIMYQQNIPYDDINRRALVPMESIPTAIPILNVSSNDIPTTEEQLATDDKYDDIYRPRDLQKLYDKYNKLKEKPYLEDPDKQVPFKRDILDNVEKIGIPVRRSSDVYNPDEFDKGATAGDTSEEEKPPVFRRKNNISCEICGGSYNPDNVLSTNKHFDTAKHKKALDKLEAKKK